MYLETFILLKNKKNLYHISKAKCKNKKDIAILFQKKRNDSTNLEQSLKFILHQNWLISSSFSPFRPVGLSSSPVRRVPGGLGELEPRNFSEVFANGKN